MVERELSLARDEAARAAAPLMHLSARESVAALRHAHERSVKATAEVYPHHLVLTDEAVRSLDPNVKMNPPLRAEDDRRALIDALRDGHDPPASPPITLRTRGRRRRPRSRRRPSA